MPQIGQSLHASISLNPVARQTYVFRCGARVIFPPWSLLFLHLFLRSFMLVGFFLGVRTGYQSSPVPSCRPVDVATPSGSQFVLRILADSSGRRGESHTTPHDYNIEPKPFSS